MVEEIGDRLTKSEGEIVAVAASADESVVSTEHFLPTVYQFLKLIKVFSKVNSMVNFTIPHTNLVLYSNQSDGNGKFYLTSHKFCFVQ